MTRVLTVIGARPQFVKAAVLSEALERHGIAETVVNTGQHYDDNMAGAFFRDLRMRAPDYELHVGSASHAVQTGEIMRRLEPLVARMEPDYMIVLGDTNSTIAGALVAAKMHVPIAHVEAGLRSFDRRMPEEVNRVVVDHLATRLFAPTELARQNLAREGISNGVSVVGDLMADLVLRTVRTLPARPAIMDRFRLQEKRYAVATIHRESNTTDPAAFESIVAGLRLLEGPVILPAHPRTLPLLLACGVGKADGIRVTEPLPYAEMIALVAHARVLLTDSGGLQKEAALLGTPCVTLRNQTEWVETVESGWNVLAGCDPIAIASGALRGRPAAAGLPYGDGTCADSIASSLLEQPVDESCALSY